jgi:DNA-binding FrmR family transcriptional regulator
MTLLTNEAHRTDLLNRLKRAEGQLRGVQRMISEGQPCFDIAGQMSAVRKALDSAYMRMTVCYMQQEVQSRLGIDKRKDVELDGLLGDVKALMAKIR